MFSDFLNSNISITKPKIPWKCNFKSDEGKNKHSLTPCKEIVKFRHSCTGYLEKRQPILCMDADGIIRTWFAIMDEWFYLSTSTNTEKILNKLLITPDLFDI